MTASDILMLALMLLGAHWLADYPLQGQFLSDAKVIGRLTDAELKGLHARMALGKRYREGGDLCHTIPKGIRIGVNGKVTQEEVE